MFLKNEKTIENRLKLQQKPDENNQLFKDENWKRMLLAAGRAKKIRHPGIYLLWVEVVEKFSNRRVTESIDMGEMIIEAVAENVGIFNHNYKTQSKTLRMLERIVPYLRVESLRKMFQKNLIEILGLVRQLDFLNLLSIFQKNSTQKRIQ